MNKRYFAVAFLFAAAAMAQNVEYNFDQDVDFKQYRTYRWEAQPGSGPTVCTTNTIQIG